MNIERHISNLKQYIKDDEIIEKDGSDFANFCKGHIDDIQALIDYIKIMHKEFDRLEGIEDNTSMLKQELIETKEHNRQLALELKKKNKVIDEMAEYITNLDVDEDICKNIEHCASDKKLCRDCIKEYFYKKVE